MSRKVQFTGKNIEEVFNLPCVREIYKGVGDKVCLYVKPTAHSFPLFAYAGDWLIEEDGRWYIKNGEQMNKEQMSKALHADTLHLVLTYKWYDMIASGEKKEEYRENKWTSRIIGKNANIYNLKPKYKTVTFHRGYSSTTMTFYIEGVYYNYGKPEWGAPKDKKVIIIKLGKRIEK